MKTTAVRTTKLAATSNSARYRVGSLNKTGRLLWAYNEEMTLDEATEIAASSRTSVLAPGFVSATARILPLPPRASQRLEKLRQAMTDHEQLTVELHFAIHDGTVEQASHEVHGPARFVETCNRLRLPGSPAAVLVTRAVTLSIPSSR